MTTHISPDCRDEFKHRACGGEAWDDAADQSVRCTCSCHQSAMPTLTSAPDSWGFTTVHESTERQENR